MCLSDWSFLREIMYDYETQTVPDLAPLIENNM